MSEVTTLDWKIKNLGDVVAIINEQCSGLPLLGSGAEPIVLTMKQLKQVCKGRGFPPMTPIENVRVMGHPVTVVLG